MDRIAFELAVMRRDELLEQAVRRGLAARSAAINRTRRTTLAARLRELGRLSRVRHFARPTT